MKKDKLAKLIAKIALITAAITAFFTVYLKYKKFNSDLDIEDEYEDENDDDNFDKFDFDKMNHNTDSRDYVSIKINKQEQPAADSTGTENETEKEF